MSPSIKLEVVPDFSRLDNMMKAAGKNAGPAINRAVNRTGEMARTQMVKVLVPQTGLKYRAVRSALKLTKAGSSSGSAVIKSRGGDIRLKFFGPRETRKGTSAAPRSRRQVFAGTFMKGGLFPDRKTIRFGKGQVFKRVGSSRLPIVHARSGVFIPEEMIRDASATAFYSTVARVLPDRLAHELLRML